MKDKVVLITGGTSGIGLKAAELFLDTGAAVIINGRDEEKGRKVLAFLKNKKPDGKIFFVAGDVSRVSDCEKIVKESAEILGGIDILVNSAGIYFEK